MGWIGGVAGGAAAAVTAAKRQEEEAAMLDMLKRENGAAWEYKIVRSALYGFDRRGKIGEMLEQEARAGWSMAAKLDGERVVLKRPVAMRAHDQALDPEVDPYRTDYGGQTALLVGVLAGLGLLLALGTLLLVLL